MAAAGPARAVSSVFIHREREAGGHGRRKTKVKAWFVRCFATDLSANQTKPNPTDRLDLFFCLLASPRFLAFRSLHISLSSFFFFLFKYLNK
jgi:hypothetical protein